jgi:hypothetical protein
MMPLIIAKVTKKLIIPRKMRGIFPNEKELIIDLPAGVPTEVPKYVADYYIENRPHIYRLATDPAPIEPEKPNTEKVIFDPIEFMAQNYNNIGPALKELNRAQLLKVGNSLKLFGIHKQPDDRIIERIVYDIATKENQQAEKTKMGIN